MEEERLIKQLQAEDSSAYHELVKLYQDKIINTCFGFVHNIEEAEDLAQEVFIQVFNSIKNFRGESKLGTWIYRIAINKSLNKIRSRRSAIIIAIDSLFESEKKAETGPSESPYKTLENKERAEILHKSIRILPENQKSAFVLSKYQGLKNKQIADIMNLSLSAVEALLNRAKKNLQKSLVRYYRS